MLAPASDLYFLPPDQIGSLNDLATWFDYAALTYQAPTATDRLFVSISTPGTIYTSDLLGSGGGPFQVRSLELRRSTNAAPALLTIAPSLTNDFTEWVIGDTNAPSDTVYTQDLNVNLSSELRLIGNGEIYRNLRIEGTGVLTASSLTIGVSNTVDGGIEVDNGGQLDVSGTLNLVGYYPSRAVFVGENSKAKAGGAVAGSFFGSLFKQAGGVLEVGDVQVFAGSERILTSTGGSATFGDISVSTVNAPLFEVKAGEAKFGDLEVNGTVWPTLFKVTDGAIVSGGDLNFETQSAMNGQIASVSGSSTLTLGDLSRKSFAPFGTGTLFNVNDASLNLGHVDMGFGSLTAAILEATKAAKVTAGDVVAYSYIGGTAVKLEESEFTANSLLVSSANDLRVEVKNGSTVAFLGSGPFGGGSLGLSSAKKLELLIDGGSKLKIADTSSVSGGAGSRLDLNGSTLEGDGTYPILQVSGNAPANLIDVDVHANALVDGLDLRLTNAVADFTDSSLTGTAVRGTGAATLTFTNMAWQDGLLDVGAFGGLSTASVTNSTFYQTDLIAGYNSDGDGRITIGSGAQVNGYSARLGVNRLPSTGHAGKGTLNVVDGAEVWMSNGIGLGAEKLIYNSGESVVYVQDGAGVLNVQTGSRVVVGGSNSDGGFGYAPDPGNALAVGTGSSVNIDATSAMFVGAITESAQATSAFVQGALVVASGGTIYGGGSINGVINSASNPAVLNIGGTISPGLSPGHLTIGGNYVQNAGDLVLEIGGAGAGQYDQLTATNGFTFRGGRIVLNLVGGYNGDGLLGTSLAFLQGPSFDWTGFDLTNGFVNNTGVALSFGPDGRGTFGAPVPEPASLTALALGLAALARRRSRRGQNANGAV